MQYRAVANRCAVYIPSLELPMSEYQALEILESKGFKVVDVDIIALARQCINNSVYRLRAKTFEAPATVDCSSFVKWIYGQRGVYLPRLAIQQRGIGISVPIEEIRAGDTVFTTSSNVNWRGYYHKDPEDAVGHVGIATGVGTVIHATYKLGVTEIPLEDFIDETRFRGVRRYISEGKNPLTIEVPAAWEIESDDDFKWVVLGSFPMQ